MVTVQVNSEKVLVIFILEQSQRKLSLFVIRPRIKYEYFREIQGYVKCTIEVIIMLQIILLVTHFAMMGQIK